MEVGVFKGTNPKSAYKQAEILNQAKKKKSLIKNNINKWAHDSTIYYVGLCIFYYTVPAIA